MTTQEELELTNTAIRNCLSAQSYTIAGRAKQMAQYESLCKRKDQLERRIADSGNNGSMCSLGQIVESSP